MNGTLYGITPRARSTVFTIKITCAASCVTKYKQLYSFGNGFYPYGRLRSVNGTLYGTTAYGGKHNGGMVFSLSGF